jgi:hypothetical protein
MADAVVSKLAIFGERCSGTNYAEALIHQNVPGLETTGEYGWKHGFITPGYIKPDCIFVAVTRNALDWLPSLYRTPHQVGFWVKEASFSAFLRHEWSGVISGWVLGQPVRSFGLARHMELMWERHPLTAAPIRNVVELRNLKLQALRKLQNLTPHVVYLRYEDLRDDPVTAIAKLRATMGLPAQDSITPVNKDVSRTVGRPDQTARSNAEPAQFSTDDLRFVLEGLDLAQEAHFGYTYDDRG